jgi:putative Ca2+/H+ antiporter (TMEM165/GDT1 family)
VTIFAAKLNKVALFLFGSAIMTCMQVISVCIGMLFPYLLTPFITHIVSVILFLAFGIYMLYSSVATSGHHIEDERHEIEEKLH